MKKISLALGSLLLTLNLNAAVVATVDGKNITDTQINEDLASALGGQKLNSLPEQQKRLLIQQYIAQMLLLEEAKKQGFNKGSDFNKELERAKDQIALNLYHKKLYDSIKVDNSKIKAAYDKNKSQFVRPAGVRAKHILVKSEAEAKSIINDLKNLKGESLDQKFSELARTRSIDGSAQNGGELGWFGEGDMVKPFSDAAFSLKKGDYSKTPIKTDFGYHIILKQDAQARTQLSFDQVKPNLENDYKMQELQRLLGQKANELYGRAKVELK
ncbi:peptidylprolyl isomerase [Campylobacter troglodytis]|uniref:peptidylprolyl isomerase n=1 Tax=Campylobacter troglodytis TaxID=654363 RepID=UPI0011597B79|nr:peptidylprolyl isomerase [Campylobacter troglodytis]TQR61414.1 peptidylprolyl isomerase [Campylobacter troglodytis]